MTERFIDLRPNFVSKSHKVYLFQNNSGGVMQGGADQEK